MNLSNQNKDILEAAKKILLGESEGYTISTIGDEENDFYDVYTNKHGLIVNVVPNSKNTNPEAAARAAEMLKHSKGEHFKESKSLEEASNWESGLQTLKFAPKKYQVFFEYGKELEKLGKVTDAKLKSTQSGKSVGFEVKKGDNVVTVWLSLSKAQDTAEVSYSYQTASRLVGKKEFDSAGIIQKSKIKKYNSYTKMSKASTKPMVLSYVKQLLNAKNDFEESVELEEGGGGMGDWMVVDLNTKKFKYFKTYDGASKYVKKNGGIVVSSEYYADHKDKFK